PRGLSPDPHLSHGGTAARPRRRRLREDDHTGPLSRRACGGSAWSADNRPGEWTGRARTLTRRPLHLLAFREDIPAAPNAAAFSSSRKRTRWTSEDRGLQRVGPCSEGIVHPLLPPQARALPCCRCGLVQEEGYHFLVASAKPQAAIRRKKSAASLSW